MKLAGHGMALLLLSIMPLRRFASLPFLLAILLAASACESDPSAQSAIATLTGRWDQASCTIAGTLPPKRTEDCLGSAPEALTVDSTGAWRIDDGNLPGEDPGIFFTGSFAKRGGRLWADYTGGGSYRVEQAEGEDAMTWTASAPYTFAGQTVEEPAQVKVTWTRAVVQMLP